MRKTILLLSLSSLISCSSYEKKCITKKCRDLKKKLKQERLQRFTERMERTAHGKRH